MVAQPESEASRAIRKWLAEMLPGSFWFKVHGGPYQRVGVSDNLGVWEGHFIAIELKMFRGKGATPHQRKFIDDVNAAGGIAFVYIYNPVVGYYTAALEVVNEILRMVTERENNGTGKRGGR